MRDRVAPQEMALHYLLTHRNDKEFQFRPDHWDVEAYRVAFESRGAVVQYDRVSGLMTIRHNANFRTLLSEAEISEDRQTLLLGLSWAFAFRLGVVVACAIALLIGATAITAWFGFLAVLCVGGAAFEQKNRKERLIIAAIFLAIAACGLPWSKWSR